MNRVPRAGEALRILGLIKFAYFCRCHALTLLKRPRIFLSLFLTQFQFLSEYGLRIFQFENRNESEITKSEPFVKFWGLVRT